MKKLFQSIMIMSTASVLVVACKKENLSSTQDLSIAEQKTSNQSGLRGGGGTLPTPKKYILVKNGSDSIFYYNDGRLAKVKHNFSYTQYNYGFNTIIAKTYSGGQLDNQIEYQIDVNTGRTFESKYTGYTYYSQGTVVVNKTHKYVYDANGRLTKKYNKNAVNERAEFTYNANKDLQNVFWYNNSNQHQSTLALEYNNWNQGMLLDKVKLNPVKSGLDPYLNIFGKFASHIITGQDMYEPQNGTPVWGEDYKYTMNADGYPTQYDRFHWATSQFLGTTTMGYIVQ